MRRPRWSIPVVALLAGVFLLPAIAFAAPETTEICHFNVDDDPGVPDWELVEVNSNSVDAHFAHGDGFPGEEVPGTDGDSVFDEKCVPQLAELVFAVAFTDLNNNHVYDPDDKLISKLVDGDGEAGDRVPGPGDIVISAFYPKDFAGISFGSFQNTRHVVDFASSTETGCGAGILPTETAFATTFSWRHVPGALFEDYLESDGDFRTFDTFFVDRFNAGGDVIRVSSDSPSSPSDDFAVVSFEEGNQAFVDIMLNEPCGSGP